MKKNRIIYLTLAALAIIVLILLLTERNSTWRKVHTDFSIEDTASVYRIFLADKAGRRSDLIRTADGNWELNGKYEARKSSVDLLLETMLKVSVRQAVPQSAHNNVISRMGAIATKVEIYQHKPLFTIGKRKFFVRDRLSKVYYVGDATMDNRGTYMLMDKSSRPFIMYIPGFRGFLHTRYSPKETDWRNHRIFSYRLQEIRSIKVEFLDEPQQSFRVDYAGGNDIALFRMIDQQKVLFSDTIKMLDFLVSFTDVRFENFLDEMPAEVADSIRSTKPMHIITVTDALGRMNSISTFPKTKELATEILEGRAEQFDLDRLYILLGSSNELVLGQYFALDRLLQPLSFYLAE